MNSGTINNNDPVQRILDAHQSTPAGPEPHLIGTDFSSLSSEQMIVATLNTFCHDSVVEIRCLDAGGRRKRTDSGYFDDYSKAAKLSQQYVKDRVTRGVYFVLNPFSPELLARSCNRFTEFADTTTADSAITSRRWLYVDCDPVRPAGISSTNDQVQRALDRMADVSEWLRSQGLCEPITAMSGNGAHGHVPVMLRNDPEHEALVKGVLRTLDSEFSDMHIKIDTAVSNAARICRLYGTIARKGDSTADRPHRMARLLHVPDYIQTRTGDVCDVGALQAVAEMTAERKTQVSVPANIGYHHEVQRRFLMAEYLRDGGFQVKHTTGTGKNGATLDKWILNECPFDSDHKAPDSYCFQEPGGAHGFFCSHDGCKGNRWDQFKALFEPRPEHYDPPRTPRVNGQVYERLPYLTGDRFCEGERVRAADRGNIGTVVQDEGGPTVKVEFVGKEGVATLDKPRSLLQSLEGSAESSEARTFEGKSAADLWDLADQPVEWMVENVFSVDQPTIFGAKQKSLKTTLLTDLAVSLASGLAWLGRFQIPQKRRVLFVTGEASEAAAIRKVRRAAVARNLRREDFTDSLRIEAITFPTLPSESDCAAVAQAVKEHCIEVVLLDPLYMGLQGLNTANLTEVGPAMRRFMTACRPANVIIAHHVKKTASFDDAPNLEDLSQAGIAEFAGNYWLMGRMSEYTGDGHHELAIRYGGRDEQFGLLKLDFDERAWTAAFTSLMDHREDLKQRKENERVNEMTTRILKELNRYPEGVSESKLAAAIGTRAERQPFQTALAELEERKAIACLPEFKPERSNRTTKGWALVKSL